MPDIKNAGRTASMPKAAIIIPIYNVEKYVRKTIESAINQTEADIEIILVDDGSEDSSGVICDEYAASDRRIKVVHKENEGLSSARNTGTQLATSEYVMYLDGDDYLATNSVKRLLEIVEQNPCDFVQFRYEEVTENQKIEEKANENCIYYGRSPKELFEKLYSLGGVAASCATKFIRRELMLEIPFVSIRHEDEMWCTCAFQKSLTAVYISDVLYYYVMRKNSIIHSNFNESKIELFRVIEERVDALKKLKLDHLVHFEYERMFKAIINFYCEATDANNKNALARIKKQFLENKKKIKEYANLQKKHKFLFQLLLMNYSFIKIYGVYICWCNSKRTCNKEHALSEN